MKHFQNYLKENMIFTDLPDPITSLLRKVKINEAIIKSIRSSDSMDNVIEIITTKVYLETDTLMILCKDKDFLSVFIEGNKIGLSFDVSKYDMIK